jgi:hypothetical protein
MNLLPVLLRNQETMLKSNNNRPVAFVSCLDLGPTATTPETVSSFAPSPVRYAQHIMSVRSAFERLGVYRRKVTRYQDQRIQDMKGNVKSYKRDILSTAEEISALWAFSGFGLTFIQQYPYGGIFPSLKMYPVGRVGGKIHKIIIRGSAQQFHEEISSGAVHPFMREANGWSLLHVSRTCQSCACLFNIQYSMLLYTTDRIYADYSLDTA